VLARVPWERNGATTVCRQSVGPGVLEGQFRRVARPAGPMIRRLRKIAQPATTTTLLARMNAGQGTAPLPKLLAEMATPSTDRR
jgi:hypothetical protein